MAAGQRTGQWWQTLLQESMKAAGEEEKAIVLTKNRTHDRIPAITVIVDSGWSKCAHKHSYNVKSGVGIIMGLDDVRAIPIASHQNIDQAMLCDIQLILSRLVAKVPQLIGRHSIFT